MKKCFWLSSYPKSGNTWLRLILCGLYFTDDGVIENFDILKKIPKFDVLKNFKFIKDISTKDHQIIFSREDYNEESLLTCFRYYIEAQKRINLSKGNFSFFKTHNARAKINNNYYTDESTTAGFIYLSRDPRDVVVSYSNYLNQNYDEVIDFLIKGQLRRKSKNDDESLPELLLNWKNHYNSWKKFDQVPRMFIKYEDLKKDLEGEIVKILNFFKDNFNIGIENKNLRIKNLVQCTSFNNLKEKENSSGFRENSQNKGLFFFREGKTSQWKSKLSEAQVNNIVKNFENELKELKYI